MPDSATLSTARSTLDDQGYVVLRDAVDPAAVATALRRLNLAIRHHGLSTDEIWTCQLATFFPHLRWEPEVWGRAAAGAAELLGWTDGDAGATRRSCCASRRGAAVDLRAARRRPAAG
jgi:hypothetical protein